MTLMKNFRFSQGSLQDFNDCRRRFQLRYLDRLDWPAVETEPALEQEELMRMGALFHRLIHQHQLGIDPAKIEATIREADLLHWWQNYLDHPVPGLPEARFPEYVLTVPLGGYRLLAKMDLIAVQPGEKLIVVDWKTSRKTPPRQWLANRLQTQVYRYVAAEAGAHLNGGKSFAPEQVSFVYWFANNPGQPEIFEYSSAEHEAVRTGLENQIGTIEGLQNEHFFLTDDERECRFCAYRSLCGRGVQPGDLNEMDFERTEDVTEIDLDLEQIGEIAF